MDKYDRAVAYLRAHRYEIEEAFQNPSGHPAGCLFQYVTPTGALERNDAGKPCGCLVQVAERRGMVAYTEALTEQIQSDGDLPRHQFEIGVEHLYILAKWQRRIDILLNRANTAEVSTVAESLVRSAEVVEV